MGSMGDAARRRQQWTLIVCKPRFDILFRMLKHANVPPLMTTFPASQPCDLPDPLPVMRREMKLLLIELSQLRIEVEQLRAREEEAQNVNKFLYRVIESRDEWRREAQRLRALMAKLPRWLLFCGRCLDALKTSQAASEGLDVHQSPSHCP
jgi:hypothetical protein